MSSGTQSIRAMDKKALIPKVPIPWDAIFSILEDWQKALAQQGISLPSVSALALDPTIAAGTEQRDTKAWVVLVSTLISLRTKDAVTLASSRRLLSQAPTAHALLKLSEDQIAAAIYPAGFYRTKAKNLLEIARIVETNFNGMVPDRMETLLELPGVGRKTANLVLSEAFEIDAICVDTHVHRISNRTGWVRTKTPDETEAILRQILPRQYWRRINWLLVLFGQQICGPQSPACSRCPLKAYCLQTGVERSR